MGVSGDDISALNGNAGVTTDCPPKECHHADQTEIRHTSAGGGRCRGGYRGRTDGDGRPDVHQLEHVVYEMLIARQR
jgi:hypothetical protein